MNRQELYDTVTAQFALTSDDEIVEFSPEEGEIKIQWSDRLTANIYEFDRFTGKLTTWEGEPC